MTDTIQRTDLDLKALRRRLLARRKELLQSGADVDGGVKPVEIDQSSSGHLSRLEALESQAMERQIDHHRHQELRRLEAALKRMEEGEYGYCVACGEEIAAKRLENDPTTPICINCASEQKRGPSTSG